MKSKRVCITSWQGILGIMYLEKPPYSVGLYISCVPGACGGQKRMSDLLRLGMQTLVSCHVSVGLEQQPNTFNP